MGLREQGDVVLNAKLAERKPPRIMQVEFHVLKYRFHSLEWPSW